MNTYIITGGRVFGDISDKALEAGSAEYHSRYLEYKWVIKQLQEYLDYPYVDNIKLVFGDASGVDNITKHFCINHCIPYQEYKAEWSKYYAKGKSNPAGPIRNRLMVSSNSDALSILIFPGGKGTANCSTIANEYGIKPIRFEYKTD